MSTAPIPFTILSEPDYCLLARDSPIVEETDTVSELLGMVFARIHEQGIGPFQKLRWFVLGSLNLRDEPFGVWKENPVVGQDHPPDKEHQVCRGIDHQMDIVSLLSLTNEPVEQQEDALLGPQAFCHTLITLSLLTVFPFPHNAFI